jgi:uncharacterized membrane protein
VRTRLRTVTRPSHPAGLDQPLVRGRFRSRPGRPRADSTDALGRASEWVASYMGTPAFLAYMTLFILAWLAWNALGPADLRFDPYTFTFLTLLLSLQASYSAPLILLAQQRQTDRDKVGLENDRQRAERGLADTEYLARELASVRITLREMPSRDYVAGRIAQSMDRIEHELTQLRELLAQQPQEGADGAGGHARGTGGRRDA